MSFYKYILTGLTVALLSLGYNFLIFEFLNFYPDAAFFPDVFGDFFGSFYVILFLRGFILGMVLMFLFAHGANSLASNTARFRDDAKTVFFFTSYGLVSLVVFTLGDFVLMGSPEGFFVLLTVDSFVETLIALIPIRIFYFSWFKGGKKVDL